MSATNIELVQKRGAPMGGLESFNRVFSRQFAAFWLIAYLVVCSGLAHDPFEITTDARLGSDTLRLEVTMSRWTAWALRGAGIPDKPAIEPGTLEDLRLILEAIGRGLFRVSAGARTFEPGQVSVSLSVENDVEFRLSYALDGEGLLRIDAVHLQRLPPEGYGAMTTVLSDQGALLTQKLLRFGNSATEVPWCVATRAVVSKSEQFRTFFGLGLAHILTGYDHLLFLCGLLVACRGPRTVGVMITCFTLAHSITLALAALNIVTLPGWLIEPVIAASIVFVGIDNILRSGEPKGRWLVTFVFGLVHGFGFAGALRTAGLGGADASLAMPLFSFNLGIEVGQIGVAAVFLPALWQLRRWRAFDRYHRRILSTVVAVLGGCWFLQRVFFT